MWILCPSGSDAAGRRAKRRGDYNSESFLSGRCLFYASRGRGLTSASVNEVLRAHTCVISESDREINFRVSPPSLTSDSVTRLMPHCYYDTWVDSFNATRTWERSCVSTVKGYTQKNIALLRKAIITHFPPCESCFRQYVFWSRYKS